MPPWVHDDLLVSPMNVRWTDTAKEELKEVFGVVVVVVIVIIIIIVIVIAVVVVNFLNIYYYLFIYLFYFIFFSVGNQRKVTFLYQRGV